MNKALFKEKILVLDGAMGTMVQSYNLTEGDFRGDRLKDHGKDLKAPKKNVFQPVSFPRLM